MSKPTELIEKEDNNYTSNDSLYSKKLDSKSNNKRGKRGGGKNKGKDSKRHLNDDRIDSVSFKMNKDNGFLSNVLNDTILKDGGINLEGLTIENANLNRITTAGKLPIFGDNLYVDGALENNAFGDSGYIIQQLINDLPFIRNSISNITDFNNAANSMSSLTAAMPFTVSKTIKHNYKGMDDITRDNHIKNYCETLFFEDVADVMQTFLDSYGTKYVVNDLRININNADVPAFPYIMYYYDVTMLHVMSVFRHYSNFKSSLNYGEKVSVTRNDVLNELDGPIFKSSTMIGAQSSTISALTKLPLPMKYFVDFISSVYCNGKVTSGRITPMEFVNCDIVKPSFKPIKNVTSSQVYIPTSVWTNLWDAADNVIKAYDLVSWDNWIFDSNNINKWPVISKRTELIKVWNDLTYAINVFYNQMIDYLVALQRGLKSNAIKCYTNPDNIIDQVRAINTLQQSAIGVEGNNAMINAYNYVNQLVTTNMTNGVLIKSDFVPDLTLKGFLAHDSVLLFLGEEQQYIKLYETDGEVTITINNPSVTINSSNLSSVPHFILKPERDTNLNTGRWSLHYKDTTKDIVLGNNTLANIKFNHPFIHYILGNLVVNLQFKAVFDNLTGTSGTPSVTNTVIQDSRVYSTIEYTVNTISKYISNMFKYYSTR